MTPKKKRRGAQPGSRNAAKPESESKPAQIVFRCSAELKSSGVAAASPGPVSDWMVAAVEARLKSNA